MIGDMETDEIGAVLTAESEDALSTTYEEVDVDDDRVTAEATYSEDALKDN